MEQPELFAVHLHTDFRDRARFVGREAHLRKLRRLLDRESATVLVAGVRGTGKTALVRQAIATHTSERRPFVAHIAPPLVNPEQLELSNVRRQLLRSFARSLHLGLIRRDRKNKPFSKERISKDHREHLELVYDMAVTADWEQHSSRQLVATAGETQLREITRRRRIDGAPIAAHIAGIVSVTAIAISTSGWALKALLSIVVLALTLLGAWHSDRLRRHQLTTDKTESATTSAASIRKPDLSDDTLEFELNALLAALKHDTPVVFVLDELDKLEFGLTPLDDDVRTRDHDTRHIEDHPIVRILSSLKNFLSLGDAVYIFIADDAFYRTIIQMRLTGSYNVTHTLFSDILHVGPLSTEDVSSLIDQLAKTPAPRARSYEQFKSYVSWESRNHPFDVMQILESFVDSDQDTLVLRPTKTVQANGAFVRGSLPDDWMLKAALQEYVAVFVERDGRSGVSVRSARYNSALLECLYAIADLLLSVPDVETVAIIGYSMYRLDIVDEGATEPHELRLFDTISGDDYFEVVEAIQRMLAMMERHHLIDERETVLQVQSVDEGLEERTARTYRLLTKDLNYPPRNLQNEAALSHQEELYVEKIARLRRMWDSLETIANFAPDEQMVETLETLSDVRRRVEERPDGRSPQRAAVTAATRQADVLIRSTIEKAITSVVDVWAADFGTRVQVDLDEVAPRSGNDWRSDLNEHFGALVAAIDDHGMSVLVVGSTSSENAVLVLINPTDEEIKSVQAGYIEALSESAESRRGRSERLPIIHVGIDTDKTLQSPMESSLAELSAAVPTPLEASRGTNTKSDGVPLMGWRYLDLSVDLHNIMDLVEVLKSVSHLIPSSSDS